MLLQAYAFWKIGQIALYAGIASLILAGLMLIRTVFGIVHLRRVDPDAEVLPAPRKAKVLKTVTA